MRRAAESDIPLCLEERLQSILNPVFQFPDFCLKNTQRLHRVNWYFKKLLLSPAVFQAKAKLGFNCQRKKTQSRSWTGQAWRVKNYCTTACQNRKENQERDHLKICVTFRWQQVLEISGAPLQAAAGLHSTFISIRSACVILRCL